MLVFPSEIQCHSSVGCGAVWVSSWGSDPGRRSRGAPGPADPVPFAIGFDILEAEVCHSPEFTARKSSDNIKKTF